MGANGIRKITFSLLILVSILFVSSISNANSRSQMSEKEYRQRLRSQTKYHQLLKAGDIAKKGGDNQLAAQYYEQALDVARGSSLEGVTRGELSRLYEQMGLYEKALENVEWILKKADKSSPLLPKYVETKNRLLKHLQDKKAWEKEQDPIVLQFKESFEKASHEEQAEYLNTLGGEGVWEDFKSALVAEHAGNFSEARQIYESLLAKKAEIEKEMGVHGWAMLYPAIQRTSELLGDREREKEVLEWIKTNLLSPNGEYHASLSKLLPEVVAHIKERLREYNL